MKKIKDRVVKTAGCEKLMVVSLRANCGQIRNGVAFAFESGGAWVVDLADLRSIVESAEAFNQEPEHTSELVMLLEHCDSAMTAAGAQLWDVNRDLSLELNRRAARCRLMVGDLQQNDQAEPRGN